MPHTTKGFVDELHDLWRALSPPQLEQLLPNMTGITVDDRLGDATEKLVDHDGLVVLWDRVECLLDNVASKRIHRQIQSVATNRFGNFDDLLRGTVLEATLDKKVAKAVDHERIGLGNNSLHNLILLLGCAHFELLLKKNRCLLVIVAHNFVDDILPVAVDVAVEKTTVVQRLSGWKVGLTFGSNGLDEESGHDNAKDEKA